MSIDALRKFKPTSPDLIVRKRLYSDATLAPVAYVNELNDKLTEVITEVNALTIEGYKGVLDCSTNPNYPAGVKDWYWRVSVAGKIGGASGIEVEVGDMIICTITNNGGTHAAVGADFMIVEKNMFPCAVATLRTGTDNFDFVTAKTLADQGFTFSATQSLGIGGTVTKGIDFSAATPAFSDSDDAFIAIGTWNDAIVISSQTQHFVPIQVHLDSNTSVNANIAAARLRVDTIAANTLTNVYALQTRNTIANDVASAYGINASMSFGTMAVQTGSCAVISAYLEGTGNITPAGSNPIDVVNITNVHSGTGVTNCLNVCNNTASAVSTVATLSNLQGAVTSMLYINNANTATNGILFAGTYTNVIDFGTTAVITGSLMDYVGITTKTSGYLFNGSLITSVLDGSTLIDDFSISCAHDGLAADTLRGKRMIWSGAMPNGTAAPDFILHELQWTSTFGSAGAIGGTPKILAIDSDATINDSAAIFTAFDVNLSGMTLSSASAVYGMNLTLMAGVTRGIYISGNTTTGEGVNITSTGLTTGHALQITASVNSAYCQVINVDVAASAALTGSEAVIGCDIAVQGNGADADGTSWTCYNGKIEGGTSGRADYIAYAVDMVGTIDTADTHNGLVVSFGQTMNNAGATVYGTRISTSSFTHTLGTWYGHYINQTYTTTGGVSVGIGIDSTLSSATTKAMEINTTSSTATATLINSMKLIQIMGGASTVNMVEAAQFIVQSAVQMGNWANAVLAKIDLTTTGYVTGLAGVVCAELDMPSTGPSGSTGTYTCFEAEINMAGATNVPVSAITINTWGAEVSSFASYGYIMDLNIPVAGSGLVFQANTASEATHALKIRINGTPYYMMLTTAGA